MKAIFAVSALAAAISAQAFAADTEATTTFTGSVDTEFTINLANDSAKDVDMVEDSDDKEGFDLDMDVKVTNGPFSGSLAVQGDEGEAKVTVGDLTVSEGAITFGQVGSLLSTDDYAGDMAEAGTADVTAGFTYEVMEGLKVQLQNSQGSQDNLAAAAVLAGNAGATADDFTSYGVAAQYTGEADALSYTVEAEISGSDDAPDGTDAPTFVGVGVTYETDMITVDAGVNNYGSSDKITEVAVAASLEAAGAELSVAFTDTDLSSVATEDSMIVDADVSYAIDAITVSAGYKWTSVESAGDKVEAGVEWAQDALSASADVSIANFDADTADSLKLDLNVTYTTESGIEYYADYSMQAEEADAITAIAEKNMVALGARYSF